MFDRGEVSEWVYWTALWRAPRVLCWATMWRVHWSETWFFSPKCTWYFYFVCGTKPGERDGWFQRTVLQLERVQCSHYIDISSCCLMYVTSLLQGRPTKLLQSIHPPQIICSGSSLYQSWPKTKQRQELKCLNIFFIISIYLFLIFLDGGESGWSLKSL